MTDPKENNPKYGFSKPCTGKWYCKCKDCKENLVTETYCPLNCQCDSCSEVLRMYSHCSKCFRDDLRDITGSKFGYLYGAGWVEIRRNKNGIEKYYTVSDDMNDELNRRFERKKASNIEKYYDNDDSDD